MRYSILFFLFLFSTCLNAQQNQFKLTDSIVEINSKHNLSRFQRGFCSGFSKSFIEANKEILDSITSFLKTNIHLSIEISSHTDARGSTEFNLKLSQDWSNQLREVLMKKGISPSQITAQGYGESNPIISISDINKIENEKDRETAHQSNRRTELTILSIHPE